MAATSSLNVNDDDYSQPTDPEIPVAAVRRLMESAHSIDLQTGSVRTAAGVMTPLVQVTCEAVELLRVAAEMFMDDISKQTSAIAQADRHLHSDIRRTEGIEEFLKYLQQRGPLKEALIADAQGKHPNIIHPRQVILAVRSIAPELFPGWPMEFNDEGRHAGLAAHFADWQRLTRAHPHAPAQVLAAAASTAASATGATEARRLQDPVEK